MVRTALRKPLRTAKSSRRMWAGSGQVGDAKEAVVTAISNKTQKPLSVPLPGGKTLHLGPGRTGQISAKAVDDPRLKKLVDAGELEVIGEDARPAGGPTARKREPGVMRGHTSGGTTRRSGDR